MKRNLMAARAAALALSTLLMVPAPPRAADAPATIDQVIEQYVHALGGRTALEKHSTLVLSGNCEASAPEESGPIEILVRTPQVAFNLGKGGLQMGFTGTAVWRHAANEGLQQQAGRQYAELVTVFDPARVLSWKEWYPEIAVTGIEKLDGREAYVVETHPGSAASERILIDRQSGLLARDEVMPGNAFTFSDYRAVDGVQIPFTIQQTARNGLSYTYRFADVKYQETMDDSRFQPR
ncbi:MAG: hypothetical protein ABR973_02725 [Candidatus Acidiferrales bacterium]